MLREMTKQEWLEWQIFMALEPSLSEKADVHNAAIIREIRNVMRDTKARSDPFTLEECLLRFGDDLPPPPRRADWRKTKAKFLQYLGEHQKDSAAKKERRRT
jgi:hypothetical protein